MKKKPKKPVSQDEYVSVGWGACPFCRATQVEGGFVEIDDNKAYQSVSCNACDHSWTDIYTLTGYQDTTD